MGEAVLLLDAETLPGWPGCRASEECDWVVMRVHRLLVLKNQDAPSHGKRMLPVLSVTAEVARRSDLPVLGFLPQQTQGKSCGSEQVYPLILGFPGPAWPR